MKILGEKIGFADKKTKEILFVVILSTFLLLFLYHHDCWRPIRYWLFLDGLILFIIPLLSLVLLKKRTTVLLKAFSTVVMIAALLVLVWLSLDRHFFAVIRHGKTVYPISAIFVVLTALILVLAKVELRAYGINFGKWKFWVPIIIIFFICMVPLIFWASRMPSFQETYPMFSLARKGVGGFIVAELSVGIFFIFWEFFFRGYMLFSLEKRTGFLVANAIQAMAFAFMHFGKPELEVYSSLIGGLVIGWLAWRSKTFLPAFLIHWGIQFMMDFFAVIR